MVVRGAVAAAVVLALVEAGCATATGEISGGETRYDSAAPAPAGDQDSGAPDADPPSGDASADSAPAVAATWTELYAAYFGPKGTASCAGNGTCHGDMMQLGYMTSGFLCPPGDKEGCYTGAISPSAGLFSPPGPFEEMYLYEVLRKKAGPNINLSMPKSPPETYSFSADDLAKIKSWVVAGTPDN